MRLSVADVDWNRLNDTERATLDQVVPRLEDGYTIAEIAAQDGVDVQELEQAWQNLAARVMALSGHVELPPLSDEEFEALLDSIAAHGQQSPILRGSSTSARPGEIVDGRHRLRICEKLGIEPWIIDVDGDADWLQSLGLVLNLARRHLSASSRRGIVKAELLRDPSRSDRAIAGFVGVSPTTVGTIRRELEHSGAVSKLDTRTGTDGIEQPARRQQAAGTPPPSEKTIKVSIPAELGPLVDVWVNCRAFRLAERRAGIYVLEVQYLDSGGAGQELVDAIYDRVAALAQHNDRSPQEAMDELLRTAREVFARDIPLVADLTRQEAEWLLARIDTLTGAEA